MFDALLAIISLTFPGKLTCVWISDTWRFWIWISGFCSRAFDSVRVVDNDDGEDNDDDDGEDDDDDSNDGDRDGEGEDGDRDDSNGEAERVVDFIDVVRRGNEGVGEERIEEEEEEGREEEGGGECTAFTVRSLGVDDLMCTDSIADEERSAKDDKEGSANAIIGLSDRKPVDNSKHDIIRMFRWPISIILSFSSETIFLLLTMPADSLLWDLSLVMVGFPAVALTNGWERERSCLTFSTERRIGGNR
jgi:hypothetical protein